MKERREEQIRSWGRELGFDRVRFARAERLDAEGVRFEEWLAEGRHGTMEWLARDPARRIDPEEVLPGARSVIVVAKNYYTPVAHDDDPAHGKISRYAWGRDYHRILPKMLKKLHRKIVDEIDPETANRWYVDAGPPMEKAWAVRAGIGWLGKHTNVITRSHGSWVFLGVMFTTLELEPDDPIPDFCGSCTRCIEACPTDAITAPWQLDARRCISYLTIELPRDEPIPEEHRDRMEGWVFGCDICQDVCPWNKFEQPTDREDFLPRPGRLELTAGEIDSMTPEEFMERFQGSPIMRAKLEGMQRNFETLDRSAEQSDRSDR